ncbi:hypothetical protein lerEdw1_019084 [Lerista edwardsae]|nr:hypothetical protein lerEdw1_019084 [Lerista edwardsae]
MKASSGVKEASDAISSDHNGSIAGISTMSASSSIQAQKHSVLPPIIPESEKEFLETIQKYIISEIGNVGCTEQGPAEQYYIIYKNVFEMIIEHVNAYKSTLTTIKQEYDAFIEAVKKGQQTAFYLHGKLKVLACEPTTLKYYMKRIIQLQEKIRTIEKNSKKIETLIEKTRMLRKTPSKTSLSPTRKIKPSQKIPGLNRRDSLDIDALANHLAYLQRKVKEMKEDMLTKYIPVENAENIENDLTWALGLRDEAEAENEKLKFCYYRITQLANVVGIWENSDKTIETLQNLVSQMIEYEKLAKGVTASSISSVFECDPTKSKEAEDLIEYIERFNELFSRGQYEAAAIYAANCPRGILRNEETMEKFRAAGRIKGKMLPLLMYCEALVNSSIASNYPLHEYLAAEAIKCALDEERLDLVMHWVTLQKLPLSEAAGDAIYKYADVDKHHRSQCFALAQIAYSQCKKHKKVILCMCKQGQITGALDYLHQIPTLPTEDYIFLLRQCPSTELIRCLTQEWNGKPAPLSLGVTLLTLLNTEQKIYCLRLLEELVTEKDILENKIVNDSACTVEAWKQIAEICLNARREKLFKVLISILAAQEGVVEIPIDDADAELMNHVFL